MQGHTVVDGVDIALRHRDAGVGGEGASRGLVHAGGGGPTVAGSSGQDHQRDAAVGIGGVVVLIQHVPAGQQTGVIFQSEQIAQRGHDVHGTARFGYGNSFLHAAAPEDQRIAVAGGVTLRVCKAPQLVIIVRVCL